jgi:formylglycine-generating enzyme required for sulfatase activity
LALECFKSGYEKRNDPQGALADYNQAISFDPNYAEAYNNRGNLKKDKLNDPQGALDDYNQAISLNPKYAAAYYNRASLKDKLNDTQSALADYDQALSLNPNYASVYGNRRQFIRKDVELEMIYIPGGSFVMGAPVSEEGAGDDERPQHKVTLSPFWIGKYPVTQKQYTALMGNNPAHFQGDDLPVENVSWEDAVAFCEKLSHETKKNYRLPSEAEWEYACRAGTTTPFHFGEELSPELANYGRNVGQTSIFSKYPANAFGLHDMHGNVWEWCQDTWYKNYECKSNDTTNGHILRGGSWLNYPKHCRSARRVKNPAVDKLNYIGFRVLLFQ